MYILVRHIPEPLRLGEALERDHAPGLQLRLLDARAALRARDTPSGSS